MSCHLIELSRPRSVASIVFEAYPFPGKMIHNSSRVKENSKKKIGLNFKAWLAQ